MKGFQLDWADHGKVLQKPTHHCVVPPLGPQRPPKHPLWVQRCSQSCATPAQGAENSKLACWFCPVQSRAGLTSSKGGARSGTCWGGSACQDTAAHPQGFSCPLELTCSSTNRVPTPPFLTLIFRRYYTWFGLRMSYLDSGGGKSELAGEQRNIKRVLVRQA